MRATRPALAAVFFLFSATAARAGPICDQFQAASPEKQGAYILFMIDNLLKNWPQHDKIKQVMTDSERLGMFADARKKILSECANGKDFAAGVALGEDLAIYKMSLLDGVSGEKKSAALAELGALPNKSLQRTRQKRRAAELTRYAS